MPAVAFPPELLSRFWEKKKGALDGSDDLADRLKKLQKQHDAVEFERFADWTKGVDEEAALRSAFARLEKSYRSRGLPLKSEAQALAAAADKAGGAKGVAKPLKDASEQIAKVALGYAKSIDAGLATLEAEFKRALEQLPEDDGDEPGSALVDPRRLFKQLQRCKADPSLQLHFAMLDDNHQDPILVLHQRQAGRGLLAKLVADIRIKTGAYGMLSLDETNLRLTVEKKVSGLVKRIRIPIRACGFKLGKVTLVDPTGALLDEDEKDEATPGDDALRLVQRAKTVRSLLERLAAAAAEEAAPLRAALAAAIVLGQDERYAEALVSLDAVEARIREALGLAGDPQSWFLEDVEADGSKVAFAKIKIQWNQAKDLVKQQLESLRSSVVAEFGDAETASAARKILNIVERFNEGLGDTLDDLYNAADPREQARLRERASAIVDRYLSYVDGDPLVLHIEDNPFKPTVVGKLLSQPLRKLQEQIAAAGRIAGRAA